MNRKGSIIIGSLVGALAIHCGQSVLKATDSGVVDNNGFFDNGVSNAHADNSAPVFEKVLEQELEGGQSTKEIDVSKYRELVVYAKVVGDRYCTNGELEVRFYPFTNAPYHMTGYPGRQLVNGPLMRIKLDSGCESAQFYIAGIR